MPTFLTDETFLLWLEARPQLRWVYRDIDTMVEASRSRSIVQFRDGRDAAQRVRAVAADAGYHVVAEGCYQLYEWFCLRLLSL